MTDGTASLLQYDDRMRQLDLLHCVGVLLNYTSDADATSALLPLTAAGSMSISVRASDVSLGPDRVPGNLFLAREIYFPGINIPSENIALKQCFYRTDVDYLFTSIMLISVSHCLRLMMLFMESLVIFVVF